MRLRRARADCDGGVIDAEQECLDLAQFRLGVDVLQPVPVALTHAAKQEQLADVVTGKIGSLPGVVRTQTMVAFTAYSRHDLEAMFSLGS